MSFPIPDAAIGQHTIALGKTRAGKSSKLRLTVERLLDKANPVCVIDPKGDWWGLKSSASGKEAGYPVVIFGGEHADVPINEHSGAAVAELIATGNRPCIIDLGGWMVGARTRFFIDFASTLFRLTKGSRHLVIDECHNFAPQGKVLDPDAGKMLHWANRLASEGAGKGITLISASQRPQKVHKDYVTSHETLIACRVVHPLDRGAIKEWVDGCADPSVGKEVLANLASLDRSEAYVWSPEIGFGPQLVKWPLFKTYDSFKPQGAEAPATLKGWASVDLDDVKAKLAKVVEEAKTNDPKALKAEIARLNSELRRANAGKQGSAPKNDADALKDRERAKKEGYAEGYGEGDRDGFARGAATALDQGYAAIRDAMKAFAGVQFVPSKRAPKYIAPVAQRIESRNPTPVVAGSNPAGRTNGSGAIEAPLQRIIDAIKWWNIMGVSAPSHAQTAFIAGYSHKSGTWATYLSRLRSQGLIEGRGDLALTTEGERLASLPDAPPSGEALREAVLNKVDAPLRKILLPIFDAYPDGLDHRSAGERAGYSHSSGTWATYLSRIRSLDLIEARGELRAQDWLFPEGRA